MVVASTRWDVASVVEDGKSFGFGANSGEPFGIWRLLHTGALLDWKDDTLRKSINNVGEKQVGHRMGEKFSEIASRSR